MKSARSFKSGMISIELAISLLLVVVVIFVTLGLFGDNVQTLAQKGNFQNLFNGNSDRTLFSFFNKDYTNSQINVQVMGEQGLEMIRQKANNNALAVVPSILATDPAKSAQITQKIDTVAYLGLIINTIVGSSDICKTMSNPSKKDCSALALGPEYTLDVTNAASGKITLAKAGQDPKTYTGSAISLPKSTSTNDSITETNNIYKYISNLTNSYSNSIDTSLALFRNVEYSSSTLAATSNFENKLLAFLSGTDTSILAATEISNDSLLSSLKKAQSACGFWTTAGDFIKYTAEELINGQSESTDCYPYSIEQNDINKFNALLISNGNLGAITATIQVNAEGANALMANHSEDDRNSLAALPAAEESKILPQDTWYKNLDNSQPIVTGASDALLVSAQMCNGELCGEGGSGGSSGSGSSTTTTVTTNVAPKTTNTAETIQCYNLQDDSAAECAVSLYDGDIYKNLSVINIDGYVINLSTVNYPTTTADTRLTNENLTDVIREGIIIYYAKMLESIWENTNLIAILEKDNVKKSGRTPSCKLFVNKLSEFAGKVGLVAFKDQMLTYGPTTCIPGRQQESDVVDPKEINSGTNIPIPRDEPIKN